MVQEFLAERGAVQLDVHFQPDLPENLFHQRPHSGVQLDGLHILHIRRGTHADNRQQDKQLFLNREIHPQEPGNPLRQPVNDLKLGPCRQVIELGRQLPDIVPGQEPVEHDGQKLPEIALHRLFKGAERVLHRVNHFHIERILPVERFIAVFQDIMPDITFPSLQHQALAGFAQDGQLIWLQPGAELFQVADQRCAPDIHLIRQLVGQQRFHRAHQPAKSIVHAVLRGVQELVCFQDAFPHRLELCAVINAEAVAPLHGLNDGAAFQLGVQLLEVVSDGALAHLKPLGKGAHRR